jgi:long-chain acyl-CoA synthetase
MSYPGIHAQTTPHKAAQIMGSTGEVTTYAELDAAANRLSRVFGDLGLKPGDHIALCMENHPRYLEVVWGAMYSGLIFTACSSRLTSGELEYILNDSNAKAFITSKYKADQAAEIVAATPGVELRLMLDGVIDGYGSYEHAVASRSAEPLVDRVEGVDMLYSSGTTGRPKGVARDWKPVPLGEGVGLGATLSVLFGGTADSVYLSPAPLYHAAPLRFCMGIHALGGTVIVMDHFDPEQALALIERHKANISQWVPTMFIRMLKLDPAVRARYDVSSLKCAIHAAAPCPAPVKQQMIEWWGPVLHEYYAGTEGNGFVYCNSEMWLAHPGTVGTPIACVVHIVDDEGNECQTGESGTVYFEGGASFKYHNDDSKTASSQDPRGRGWSTLGDVGYLDADNFLYLTDRKAYMIISGGVNIYPQEAENALVTHPKVVDIAVFGVPNDDFGEEVKAVVQPTVMPSSPEEAALLERELIAFCRTVLADVKCPRSIDFRVELPRHPTGKLYKRLLKDEYWQAAGRSI